MTGMQVLFAMLFGAAVLWTLIGYPRHYGALSGRSRLFRTLGMLLLDLLLFLVILLVSGKFAPGKEGLLRFTLLSFGCMLCGVGLLGCALLDSLETYVAGRRARRAQVLEMLEETERERQKAAQ